MRQPMRGAGTLVLERFLITARGHVRDLATGRRVLVQTAPMPSRGEALARARRCAARLALSRRGRCLIDFGADGPGRWVEVYGHVAPAAEPPGLEEVLESSGSGCLRVFELQCGEEEIARVLLGVARAARLRGFVPCLLDLLARDPCLPELLGARHLVILARETASRRCHRRRSLGAVAVDLALRAARPRIVLRIAPGGRSSGSAWLEPGGPRVADFPPSRWPASAAARVAESGAVYGSAPRVAAGSAGSHARPPVERRAESLISRGRHADAERLFRRAIGALDRRGRGDEAAECGLALAALLRARGRTADAIALLRAGRHGAPGGTQRAARLGVAIGTCQIDAGMLCEAEGVLSAAELAAAEAGWSSVRADALMARARCLLWQGRFVDAEHALRGAGAEGGESVHASYHEARLALARGDLARAAARARDAGKLAGCLRENGAVLLAAAADAEVKAALGDVEGVDAVLRQVSGDRPRSLGGHWTLRWRAIRADACLRGGLAGDAQRIATGLLRRARPFLPVLLRGRLLRTAAAAAAGSPAGARSRGELDALVRATGALLLDLPRGGQTPEALASGVVDILTICHESEDERQALPQVLEGIRRRLRAVAVPLYAGGSGDRPLASAGVTPRHRPEAADRVLHTGLDLPICRVAEGVQAAAAVGYAGVRLAALVVRWPPDLAPHRVWLDAFLPACAAAVAPAVRAVIDGGTPPAPSPTQAPELLGASHAMAEVRDAVGRAAATTFPVLVLGESGSGKELVARAIHRESLRARRSFCTLNCAAVTDELFEAELFGHVRGAFTGALAERAGLFEEADGGTLFLDEVGELSGRAQAKLLRAIQYGEIRRIGENRPRRVDARIVAATNRALDQAAAQGRFRRDLLYRLDVIRIIVPPLRERPQDVPELVRHFWNRTCGVTGTRAVLAEETVAALARYDWPGNVRELENVLAALAVRAPRRGRILPGLLPAALHAAPAAAGALDAARRGFERQFIAAALARAGGRRGRAAVDLGVTRQGLAKLMRRLGMDGTPRGLVPPRPARVE